MPPEMAPWPLYSEAVWPCSDPRWRQNGRPLLQHLSEFRSLKSMGKWAREHKTPLFMLKHLLAWLENNELVVAKCERGIWQWRSRHEVCNP